MITLFLFRNNVLKDQMSPARPTGGTAFAAAHATGRDAIRTLALDTAGRLLEAHGPDALTMRRIAGEMGCSTTVLYTMFGGKAAIAEGLWREGFARLRRALESTSGADPLARLAAMGAAYRTNALENRAYYAIMFQRPIPGFEPSAEAESESRAVLQVLTSGVAECIAAGIFRPADPEHVATMLWAASHGAVSLELAGRAGATGAEERHRELMTATAAWLMADELTR